MAQYSTGTARVLSTDLNRWQLQGGTTTGNVAAGYIVKFDGEAHLWYTVATIIDATTFETVENYNGAKALDTFHPYLVTRDFTPNLALPEATQGDRNTSDIYTRALRRLDAISGPNVTRLTNGSGTNLVAGDVVAISTTTDSAVALSDVVSSHKRFVVAMEPIAVSGTGVFLASGAVQAKAQGAIGRGRYVQKSATTKAIQDGGSAMTDAQVPPVFALGVSLADAAGGMCLVLFGR